ncbi:hypothetical protein Desaci_4531 [Desulfosporosinus acidiphilus SJ4]|uniref:Uncharacterized protein n=1 Tax=Desulfosporosinus acidiphilus (strain DSM 22704 / JCM 16185 / SJ4) TaxID=646529 RepID=I4DC47_DESAJ|nr:hypothetical protein Desaci_4531 [Desulfosporosinus acidiphilus SJ4]
MDKSKVIIISLDQETFLKLPSDSTSKRGPAQAGPLLLVLSESITFD